MTEALSTQILSGIRAELNKYINSDSNNVEITADDLQEIILRHAPKEKPKRPKNAFFFWMDTLNKEELVAEYGDEASGRGGLKRLCGRLWKEMAEDDPDKIKFTDMAEVAKTEYAKAMEEFKTEEVVSDGSASEEKPKKKRGRKPKAKDTESDGEVEEKPKKKRGRKPKKEATPPPPTPDDEDDEMEVEDFEYCGVTYLLDKSTGNLYPEDAESTDVPPVGKKKGSKVVIF